MTTVFTSLHFKVNTLNDRNRDQKDRKTERQELSMSATLPGSVSRKIGNIITIKEERERGKREKEREKLSGM